MKKYFASLILSVLVLAGCSTASSSSTLTIAPFSFELPVGFTLISQSDNTAQIAIPNVENYELSLDMLLVEESDSVLPVEWSDEITLTNERVQIYNVGCGGPLYCGNLALDGVPYSYSFTLNSTEVAPENIDGIWLPQSSVTPEDLAVLISTVKPATE
jgi:hypothetical protein